jgi:hypothetical protein
MEAMRAAAYHNSQVRSDDSLAATARRAEEAQWGRSCKPASFDWAVWLAANTEL